MKATALILAWFLFSNLLHARQTCKVLIPTKVKTKPVFILDGCQIGGNLLVGGPHVYGHFVVDLSKLTSGLPDFDSTMKKQYFDLKNNRYATLKLYPFEIGSKEFKAWFRVNGVSKVITGDVLSVSKKHLDAYFTIDLKDFNFKPGRGWDLIDVDQIDIQARIYPDDKSKKRSSPIFK